MRNYRNLKILQWLDHDEFVGTIDHINTWQNGKVTVCAVYGWSKGAGFFIYTISEGHIQKIGTIKRDTLDIPDPLVV